MSIYTDFFSNIWSSIKGFIKADVEPPVKTFMAQFATDEGHLILTEAIAAAPALATGNFGAVAGQVMATVISQSEAIAAQDTVKTLQQVQSALQIAKVAQNIVSPSDQTLVASQSPSPAPVAA